MTHSQGLPYRSQLMRILNALVPQQFNEILWYVQPPSGIVPAPPASQGDRVYALLTWAESPAGCGLTQIQQALDRLQPTILERESPQTTNGLLEAGQVIQKDHKYQGLLVFMDLRFGKLGGTEQEREILLDIAFGQAEEVFRYRDGLTLKEGYARFGIRYGQLRLVLTNGLMPLHQRNFREDPQGDWTVNAIGIETFPVWEFEVREGQKILRGSRCAQSLGAVQLSDACCMVEAAFQAHASTKDLEITAQAGLWRDNESKRRRITKSIIFFQQYVEPQLQEYISKVVLRYE